MVFGSPKEKQSRLTKHSSSNSVPVSSKNSRSQTQPSKNLPVRSSSGPPRSPATSRHIQSSSNNQVPTRPTPPRVSGWDQSKSPAGHSIGSPPLGPNSVKTLQVARQPLDQSRENAITVSNPDPALCDLISSKLDAIITSIDGESFSGDERELAIYEEPQLRGGWGSATRELSKGANRAISSAVICTNYFAKANLYANSRLPPHLPPLKLHLPTYPLICLAAQYSQRAYVKPTGKEREAHVDANWRMGTKAMVIKSVPIDDMNIVIFAIRGSQTFMDWAINLNSAPISPTEFLDDPGNLCHSGFLSVARKMIKPVAARLRSLLQEDPSRSSCSLLMTGHSAGGAIASLLYAHLVTEEVRSELSILAGCFKRIHCITFGTPPLSLLPLTQPSHLHPQHRKSLFLSFINEGDPVPRADKQYVRSLLDLYVSPAPPTIPTAKPKLPAFRPWKPASSVEVRDHPLQRWVWKVPPGTLSNAGRLVVLRAGGDGAGVGAGGGVSGAGADTSSEDNIRAELTTDEQLRDVVFGDPMMHVMKLYCRRVEVLATKAVTARVWG